ncbi:hypothetical protein P1X14_17450 [Sphingomonas sp. AOB5]|uniref:hypothetical protein n=1 Tax=Sphingomonas sp. AOB5 TaxID=3034017 RepID=UPI0023F9BF92|nr:hypothetical protein [Sphingomonas sp. AOB5]MDF7777047.1 hypothetical protein [Sphingomonas sp. AOB5]
MTEPRQPAWSQTFLAVRLWIAYPLFVLILIAGDYRWIAIAAFLALVAVTLVILCPRCGRSIVLFDHKTDRNGTIHCKRAPAPPRPSSLAGDIGHRHPSEESVS